MLLDTEGYRGDPVAPLRCAIHPMFGLDRLITNLPMVEILPDLKLTFRLASMFLIHNRALPWLAHIRYSSTSTRSDGMVMLVPPKEPIDSERLRVVREGILGLAGLIEFTWASGQRFGDDTDTVGAVSASIVWKCPYYFALLEVLPVLDSCHKRTHSCLVHKYARLYFT
jgi:hypothetical protein